MQDQTKKICCTCGARNSQMGAVVKTYSLKNGKFDVCLKCVSKKICPQCRGRGEILVKRKEDKPASIQTCSSCSGTGVIEYIQPNAINLEVPKMVKIPSWVYENLRQAKLQVERKGIAIPKIISPQECPNCKNQLESVRAQFEYIKCPECGYTQKRMELSAGGNIALGIIIGLGAAALLNYLSDTK